MNFPFYEIQLQPRKLENGKYKAGASVNEHTGDGVKVILPRWELKDKEFDSEEAANRIMSFNATRYLKEKHGLEDLTQVKITRV